MNEFKNIDLNSLNDKELFELEEDIKIKEGLPHLYGFHLYKFQQDFIKSSNRDNLLCSANQIGKSTSCVIKAITWATDMSLWPKLWHSKPRTFLYFYPSLKLATVEFEEKWMKEILPRNEFKNHPRYGWKEYYKAGEISAIEFNTGVTIYFMSYSQDMTDIQAMTIWAVFCDEEMPEELYSEINARLRSTRGHLNMVFTATIGQEFWRSAIEGRGHKETFRNAFKQQISMYDCQKYADGTLSQWTNDRIEEEKQRCGTEREIQRRIYGKFIVEGGLKYPSFDRKRHLISNVRIPSTWMRIGAVDIGSGGKNHKGGIIFIAVNPEMTKGIVYKCWRGDGVITTASDMLNKFIELRGRDKLIKQLYDQACRDFFTLASSAGEAFIPSNKSHEDGERILNVLFKNDMIRIVEDDEGYKLGDELANMSSTVNKRHCNDDLIDPLRYACVSIPWDFSVISLKIGEIQQKDPTEFMNHRDRMIYLKENGQYSETDDNIDVITRELEEANEFYEM